MNKKVIIISFSLMVILFLSLWTFTAIQTVRSKSIVAGGSTSVNPFMQRATSEYAKEKNIDIVYNSTGSQAGVVGVENGMYSAGFISKNFTNKTLSNNNNLLELPLDTFEEQTKTVLDTNKGYTALKFAIDAIVLVYNPPSWFDQLKESNSKFRLDINKEDKQSVFHKMYSNSMSWEDLALELNLVDKKPSGNTPFVTFTREDGAGTRTAFSELTGVEDLANANVVNSNGMMISQLGTSEASIGYVSYSFLGNITKESGLHIAGIGDTKLGNPNDNPDQNISNFKSWKWDETKSLYAENPNLSNHDAINSDYKFKRPFNAIIKNSNPNKKIIIDFFTWLHLVIEDESNNKNISDLFEEEGLIPDIKFLDPEGKEIEYSNPEVINV